MRDTLAIVGSHPKGRGFDFDRDDCDIWVFNEALSTDWCRRAEGVFQMHKPVIWRSATNRNDKNHYDWLKSGDTPPIYMMDEFEDVPKSVRFPMDELLQRYPQMEPYFTSSVAYAIALGVYQGYKRIEIHGVEMETESEYGHQRVGVAYWVGFAQGAGVEVEFFGDMLKAPLYGYDGDVQIPIEHYEKRMKILTEHIDGSMEAYEKVKPMIDRLLDNFIVTYKTDLSELDTLILAMGQNAHNHALFKSAYGVNQHYIEKCEQMIGETGTYLVVRQEFEGGKVAGMREIPKLTGELQEAARILHGNRDKLNTNANREEREKLVKNVRSALTAYTKATSELGRLNGVMREHINLLTVFDKLLASSGLEAEEAEEIAKPIEVLA